MAVEQTIRIKTEIETADGIKSLKKSEAAVLDFSEAAKKAGKDVSKAFEKQGKAAKKSEKSNKDLKESFVKLKGSTIAAAAAIVAIGVAIFKATKTASEFESVTKKLQLNLELAGIKSKAFTNSLIDNASALQKVTRFSDGAIIKTQAILTSMGVAPAQLKEATKVVLDVASATGKTLETIALQTGKTVGGFAGELGELIPEIKALTAEQLKSGAAFTLLGQRFGGAAQADVKTFAGASDQLSNALSDVFKQLGFIITTAPSMLKVMKEISDSFNVVAENISKAFGAEKSQGLIEQFKDKLAAVEKELAIASGEVTPIGGRFEGATRAGQLVGSSNVLELNRVRNSLIKSIGVLEKGIEKSKNKQLVISKKEFEILKKKKELQEAEEKFLKRQEELRPEAEALLKQINEESETRLQAINREFQERKDKIEQLVTFRVVAEKEADEAIRKIEGKRAKDIKQLNQDIASKKGGVLEKAQKIAGGGSAALIGTIVGAIVGAFSGNLVAGAKAGGAFGGLISGIENLLGNLLKKTSDALFSVAKGIGKFFTSFGGFFGNDAPVFDSVGKALGSLFKDIKFADAIDKLIQSIDSLGDQFRDASEVAGLSAGRVQSATGRRQNIFQDILEQIGIGTGFGRENLGTIRRPGESVNETSQRIGNLAEAQLTVIDAKEFKKTIAEFGKALREETQAIVILTNQRIASVQKELVEIDKMVNLRESLRASFASSIQEVQFGLSSPSQKVADLRKLFASTTGTEKGAAAESLRSALVGQFTSAQAQAQAGIISGEELAQIQAATVSELQSTQGEVVSAFDEFLNRQKELNAQIDDLKASALEQIEKLESILQAIRDGDTKLIATLVGSFATGTEFVPRTGLALVHQGERITSVDERTSPGGGNITVNVSGGSGDPRSVADAVVKAIRLNLGGIRAQIARVS